MKEENELCCKRCGILIKENNVLICFKFNNDVYQLKVVLDNTCDYFIEKIYEEGELLSPQQHLIMKEMEIIQKKLKGPI